MNGKSIVASIVVGILGLISTCVGLIFELMPVKTQAHLFYLPCTNDLCVVRECIYLRSPAFFMMIAAIVSLIVALILISISADCGCGRGTYSSSGSRGLAILAFVFCWLTCVVAIILFLYAGVTHYGLYISMNGGSLSFDYVEGACFRPRRGVCGAGGALSFVGITLGIISYLSLVSQDYRIRRANQARSES